MEVATFVDNVTQFHASLSTGMCAAFCAAQVVKMAEHGKPNLHTVEDIDQLAKSIYRQVTGQITEPVPVNPDQLKAVLTEYGMAYEEIALDKGSIDAALSSGCPCIVMAYQDSIILTSGVSPYMWDVSGAIHAIVVSGLVANAYECRDSANLSGNPAIYDKSMNLYNVIKIIPKWRESMQKYGPGRGDFDTFFTVEKDGDWVCKKFNTVLTGGNRDLYSRISIDGSSLPVVGLPRTNELYQKDTDGYAWSVQFCERGLIVYDPKHKRDGQPGLGSSYFGKYEQFKQYDPLYKASQISDVVIDDIKAVKAAGDKLLADAGLA